MCWDGDGDGGLDCQGMRRAERLRARVIVDMLGKDLGLKTLEKGCLKADES